MSPLSIYNRVTTLSDIESILSDTDDGESHNVEFKQVRFDLNSAKKSDIGDFKLDIAKEMSAFANTDAGIIILGYDGKERKAVNSTADLQNWIDRNIADMLEPKLSGIMVKTIGDDERVVVLHIPKGKSIPYRVASVGSSASNKSYIREYYQRIGTNSIPIPEAIVRTMYRSSDSVLDIEIFPKIIEAKDHIHESKEGRGFIRIGLFVKPDSTRLIEKYYLSSEAFLLDGNFNRMNKEPITISEGSLKDSVIPPTSELFKLSSIDVRCALADKTSSWPSVAAVNTDNLDFNGTQTISSGVFQRIFALHVRTEYACDGMPMKVDNRLIVIGEKRDIEGDRKPAESYWIDERCKVVRYIDFGPGHNIEEMYSMEQYIGEFINHEV